MLVASTCVVLATRSFTDLQRARLKLVERSTAPADGTARIGFSASPALAGRRLPLALIARIHNADADGLTVTIGLDAEEVCQAVVPGKTTRRLDCTIERWSPSEDHVVTIAGGRDGWQVDALEVATHFGNTNGLNYLVILPRSAEQYRAPSPWLTGAVGAITLALLLAVPPAQWRRRWRLVHRVVSAVVVVLAVALLIAPWVSPYRIVIFVPTVVLWLAVLCLPQLWTAGVWLGRVRALPRHVAMLRAAAVAGLVTLPFAVVVRDVLVNDYGGNYSGFVKIARQAFDANPLLQNDQAVRSELVLLDSGGYDGQFAYFIAFDPLMQRFRDTPARYRDMVDGVVYRFGRVGFSLLTRVVSFSHPLRFPQAMVWLTLAGVCALAWVMSAFAHSQGRSPMYGALVLLIPGFWQSVQNALPESLAATTVAAGAVLLLRRRYEMAALFFAVSLLIRETGLLLVVFSTTALFLRGDRRAACAVAVAAVAPALLWRLYVAWTMYPALGLRGLNDYPGDLGLPLRGIATMWQVIGAGDYNGGGAALSRAGISFSLVTCAGLALAIALAVTRPSLFTAAAVAYGLIAVSLDYEMIWVHVGNAQRGTYELFLLLGLSAITVTALPSWLRWTQRLFWTATAAYVFFGAAEAEAIRAALLLT